MIPYKKLTAAQREVLTYFAESSSYRKVPQGRAFNVLLLRGAVKHGLLRRWYRDTYCTTAAGKEALLWDEFLTWKQQRQSAAEGNHA